MHKYHLFLVIAVALLQAVYAAPKDIVHFVLSSYILPNKTLSMELDVTSPRTPGNYPAVLYLTGLQGIAPNWFQQSLIKETVEEGVVWMTLSKIGNIDPKHMTNILGSVVSWLNENLPDVMTNRVPGVTADIFGKLILMGHSSAGHSMTQYLNGTCGNAKMLILFSPVDGSDPFGIVKEYVITPGKMLPFAIPTLILATQLDRQSRDLAPPCAPDSLSNTRFYNAMSGPKWIVNATKYGHCDFFDLDARSLARVMCATCKQHCDFPGYRKMAKQLILSFIDGILSNNRASLQKIEKGKFGVPSATKFDYMGYGSTPGAFCERTTKFEQAQKHISSE